MLAGRPAPPVVPPEVRLRDELISRVAHEARTPIGAILTWLQLLKSQSLSRPDADRAIEMAERSAWQLTDIVAGTEDAQRIMAGTLTLQVASLDLAGLIRSVVDRVGPDAQARSVTLDCEPVLPVRPVPGDEARLRRSFTRILAHCVGLSRPGPMLVRIQDQPTEARVDLLCPSLTLSDSLRKALQDDHDWPGFAGPHGQAVLDFALACRVIARHGGRLEAESGSGGGTRISAKLPTARAAAG